MVISPFATWMLAQEARALLTRLALVKPFALIEPMLPAASLQPAAAAATERYLVAGRREMRALVIGYLAWLHTARAQQGIGPRWYLPVRRDSGQDLGDFQD